jgi:uncharacterized membrane protein
MTTTGLLVAAVGVVLTAVGVLRARGPWARYRALKDQEDNIARYESWRGGLRDTGPTGASIAMAMFRRDARNWAIVAVAGVVLILVGLTLR